MGLGDAFMATGEIKELRKKTHDAKFIVGDGTMSYWNEVFNNNPYIININQITEFKKIIWIKNYEGNRPYRIYDKKRHKDFYTWNQNYKAKKGEIFFSKNEIDFSRSIIQKIRDKIGNKKLIFIEPYVKIRRGFQNRDWGIEKWKKVVFNLKNKYEFLHLTYGDLKPIEGCINIHGINFRNSVAILEKCDLFIGTEGGMHHAAAATSCNAVVIFGGHISPKITGYDFHKNIYIDLPDSPCGNKNICEHCKECMRLISVESIINEIEEILK